jgi:hypothetical protein
MTDYEFNNEGYNLVWCPETAYRTTANGKDTINLAADTFFALPVRWVDRPIFGMLINKYFEHTPGNGPDYGYLAHHGYALPAMQIQGELINFDWMKYVFGDCTTTGPSGSDYTHTYITTTSRGSYPDTMQLLEKIPNDSGIHIYRLHTGVAIVSVVLNSDQNGKVMATFTIVMANTITGANLTSWPTVPWAVRAHDHEHTDVTYNVGGSAYPFVCKGWSITVDNGVIADKAAGETKPERVLWGPRKILVGIDGLPKTWTDFTDAETDPASAKDIDITFKMYRNATSDYTSFAFEKLWAAEYEWGSYIFNGRYFRRKKTYILNQFESGYKLTAVQVDQKTSARF